MITACTVRIEPKNYGANDLPTEKVTEIAAEKITENINTEKNIIVTENTTVEKNTIVIENSETPEDKNEDKNENKNEINSEEQNAAQTKKNSSTIINRGSITNPAGIIEIRHDGEGITLTLAESPGSGAPVMNFTVKGCEEEDEYFPFRAVSIEITDFETGGLINFFDLDAAYMYDDFGFRLVDLNFDGYKDVMIASYAGDAQKNIYYSGYLWSPADNRFVENESFTLIKNATVDAMRGMILETEFDAPDSMWYAMYAYKNGEFVKEAGLVIEWLEQFVHDEGASEFPVYFYIDLRYPDGRQTTVNSLCFEMEGDALPEDAAEYYKPGSFWDLDDPIWRSGDHYQMRGEAGEAEEKLSGVWHAMPFVAAGFGAAYYFDAEDGFFIYKNSDANDTNEIIFNSGRWFVNGDRLYLEIWERFVRSEIYSEGSFGDYSTDFEINDRVIYIRHYNRPAIEIMEIGGGLPGGPRENITIGGETFYEFNQQHNMFDYYWELINQTYE